MSYEQYRLKYLKYKQKYFELKNNMKGGAQEYDHGDDENDIVGRSGQVKKLLNLGVRRNYEREHDKDHDVLEKRQITEDKKKAQSLKRFTQTVAAERAAPVRRAVASLPTQRYGEFRVERDARAAAFALEMESPAERAERAEIAERAARTAAAERAARTAAAERAEIAREVRARRARIANIRNREIPPDERFATDEEENRVIILLQTMRTTPITRLSQSVQEHTYNDREYLNRYLNNYIFYIRGAWTINTVKRNILTITFNFAPYTTGTLRPNNIIRINLDGMRLYHWPTRDDKQEQERERQQQSRR